jgi:histidinol dehydrogenase
MRVARHTDADWRERIGGLNRTAEPSEAVRERVEEIIRDVRARGDEALIHFTEKFGGPKLTVETLRAAEEEIARARRAVGGTTRAALRFARDNVRDFARRSMRKNWSGRNSAGAKVGERFEGFQRVGIYIPGGTAPLVSTAVMTVTLAKVAGCKEIVVVTPAAPDGKIADALLFAAELCGATEIYKVGGAQAIAALAYGTATIPPVVKIFGPGNAYVVEAKRQVFGRVAIDLLPGPSEIMVIADRTAKADWIAADLLAQAEHGHGSAILFATDSARLLGAVEKAIEAQAAKLARQSHLAEVLEQNATLLLVKRIEHAVTIANEFAPEHLSLMTRDDEKWAKRVVNAGAIFLGGYSPVAAGDFVSGPSHELPTGGAGKSFGGLTVDQFQRRTSLVRLDRRSLRASLSAIVEFAEIEGLDAHGRSAMIRLEA